MSGAEKALQALVNSRTRRVDELVEFLRIPSVSAQPEHEKDVRAAADWVVQGLKEAGLDHARRRDTGGHPAVTASWRSAGRDAPTVLLYAHYDVQPCEPIEKWDSPPFEPVVKNGRIHARGAMDDKGQLLAQVQALKAMLDTEGALPVNVVCLYEGEEEIASANLEALVKKQRDEFRCAAALVSDTQMWSEDTPAITYGLRGIVTFDVVVRGPARELHSGAYGGAVMNPNEALARIVAALKDGNGRVKVPGFYDDVRRPTAKERSWWKALRFNEARYQRDLGVAALHGEKGFTTLERTWVRPTLEVNGVSGGYAGHGFKTAIPPEAIAKISCRLVPEQKPAKVQRAVARAIKAAAPPGVRVDVTPLAAGSPVHVDPEAPAMRVAAAALEKTFGRRPVFIREGGSIPVVSVFRDVLRAPVVLMGFGNHDENMHAPNESFRLSSYDKGSEAVVRFLHGMRDAHPPGRGA